MAEVQEFLRALSEKSKFDVVNHTATPGKLRVVGRIPHDELNHNVQSWLIIARNLLLASEQAGWNIDVSKQYFIKTVGDSKKIVYAYRLIVQGDNISTILDSLIPLVRGSKPSSSVQLDRFPLHGETAERNVGKRGKGARNTVGG